MDLVISLIAFAALISAWVLINNKLKKKNKQILVRHILGAIGGAFSFVLVVAIALSFGLIESTKKDTLSTTSITESSLASSQLEAETTKKSGFREMMNNRNDYTEEAGTLIIKSESPLEVVLYAQDMINQDEKYKIQDMDRALLYGVYRTFVHTDEPQITVTSRHLDIKSLNPYEAEENRSLVVSVSVTKEQALEAIQKFIPSVETFDDLIEEKEVGGLLLEDEWTAEFEEFYWKRDGQEKLLNALRAYSKTNSDVLQN